MCVLELNYDFDGTPLRVPEDRGNDPNLAPFGLTHVVGAEEVEVEGEHQVAQPVHILSEWCTADCGLSCGQALALS